ncbi:hypothetical protein C8Q70DRAFT_246978 [Cubamyces menziesii]|uniref:F-box domain-containing protein n=1 Tax=Trametes cubensis TaxID=1111947 RepID=A0AAD7X5N8_9APHY|nr:hypothetical protein C8Q70DRAFT_246978 [Cubamyces menziesii]KAJ8462060.1 hypothetical protein ONZ51_g11141 [Trametes cubensis]
MVSLSFFPSEPPNTPFSVISFDTLPYDLLEQIFRNACTDGGRTGASLSLVSKRIRAPSRPFRFFSVSLLTGTRWQLLRFRYALISARVEAAKADDDLPLPRVRHLCIVLTGLGTRSRAGIPSSPLDRVALEHEGIPPWDYTRPLEEQSEIRWQARLAYEAELRILFARIGTAHLESLCVFQDAAPMMGHALGDIPCPDGFSRLREFWFSPPKTPPFVCSATGKRQGPLYPALRRVHMAAAEHAAIDFEWWAANAPRVKELRIATVGSPGHSPAFLESLLSTLSRASHSAREPRLWQELECVQFMYRAQFSRHDDDAAAEHAAHNTFVEGVRRSFEELYPLVEFSPDYRLQDVDAEGLIIHYGSFPKLDREQPERFEGRVMHWDWRLRMTGHEGVYKAHYWKLDPPPLLRRLWRLVASSCSMTSYLAVCVPAFSYCLMMYFMTRQS